MNATLGKRHAPGIPEQLLVTVPTGRLRLLDRLALRVGLALLLWSGRGRVAPPADEVRRLRLAAADAERERELFRTRMPPVL